MPDAWYRWIGGDLLLTVRVQPRARQNQFLVSRGTDTLKVQVQAPPIDGKANLELVRYLASRFGVPKSRVQVQSGLSSRNKRILIFAPRRLPEELSIRTPGEQD